ncbi:MAG: S8 family serine peptidase [Deltaproteobacteria bacterium]|nr:S8 family serine peptidase [Deltaproteobacteria bacterium]
MCSGTSMAAPHVTATVAMMLALNPTLTTEEIRRILVAASEPLGNYDATGDLDMITALEMVQENMGGLDEALFADQAILRSLDGRKHLKWALRK